MYSYSGGVKTVIAGMSSLSAQTADGAYPTTTPLVTTMAVCTDLNGNKYIVDKSSSNNSNSVIVKMPSFMPLQTDLTYNLVGTNTKGTFENNQLAYSEKFKAIKGMCYDSIGNLYVCDASQNIVARMGVTGIMSVYAGTLDTSGSTGDGAAATSARLNSPSDIKMSRGNILYIADTGNNRIRRVKMSGTIDTLNFTGSAILSPRCLAFDNSENLYVVGGSSGNIIYRISNFGISVSVYTQETPVITITSITVDKATNNLYFCTANTVYRIMSESGVQPVLNGLTAANGLAVDTANNLFVSDSSTNRVFKMPLSVINIHVNTLTPHIGNGDQEPEFSITGSVAPNIYGNAGPPKTRALTSPGAIIVNPSQGILVAQPTKITLLATASSESLPLCANKISQISIRNNSTLDTMYLSQIVALNSSGVNVLLRSANVSYVDGTYACKSKDTAYAIVPKMTLNIPVTPGDDIVVVLLYPSSTLKSNWNGATIRTTPFSAGATNNVVRIIQGISESVTLKNFVIDYRTKSATCAPYINFVNKYKLQSNSAPPTETSYREKWVRYVRISPAATTGTPQIGGLKRVYVIDGETGEDRIVGKLPNVSINIINSGSDTTYGVQSTRNTNLIQLTTSGNEITGFPSKNGNTAYFNSVTISDVWLEYDLMDEYPIERVILDQGSGSTSLKVSFFTSSRVLVENPTASITFSGPTPSYTSSWSPSPLVLTPVVTTTTRGTRYIRVVNGSIPTYTQATLTLSGLSPLPTGLTNLVADTAGNVYAVNTQAVYKIAGQTGAITKLFDTGSATTSGLGVDSTGNVYIADSGNHLVRKRGLDGTITTLVGTNMSSTLMVAGGYGGSSIAWSDNGKSWNASQNGNYILPICNAVAYNGSMWVAGGNGSTIAWSNDGKIWNASINGNTMFGQQFCYAIAWNGSMWVAGGAGADIADKTSLAYSYDGKNWNKSVNGHVIFPFRCIAVAWNGSMWVAGGTNWGLAGSSSIAWSNDGINWNASTNGPAIFNDRCNSVAWGESLWVAGGSNVRNGGNSLAWSDDGKTWYRSTSGNTIFTSICYAVAYNGSMWVAGGIGTSNLAWSSDGKIWNASINGSNIFSTLCNAVVWNGSIWIAGGEGTNMLAWSDDGDTWHASTYGNSMFSTYCNAVASNRALSYAPGFVDGKMRITRFNAPRGIVVDANGMIYVADTGNNAIRMINPYGFTRTLVFGLTTPRGVAIDGSTNTLYITDSNAVRTVTGNTDLYTAYTLFSGLTPSSPVSTTTNLQVLLRAKNYSGTGNWLDESGNNKSATMAVGGVNQKNSAGNGIVLNGSTYWTFPALPAVGNAWTANVWYKQTGANVGSVPAILTQQYIGNDLNISIRANGSNIFGGWIFKYNPHNYYYSNQTTTLQIGVWINIQITWNGSSMVTYVNGIQTGTTSLSLSSALGANTQMFNIGKRWDTNESGNDYVRGEIGEVRVYNRALTAIEVQAAYIESSPDFSNPQSTCIDPSTGDLYIADTRTIHKLTGITPTFPINTLAIAAQTLPIGTPATNGPYALTVTPKGTLITANGINGKLKSYTATSSVLDYTVGKVTTVAGDGSTGQFNIPTALTVDSNRNILVADTGNRCIRIIRPDGTSTVIAGASGTSGTADGAGTTVARFSTPSGIALDSKGNVYVSDTDNNRIRRLTPDYATGTCTVSTFAGGATQGSSDNSVGTSATFRLPLGICIDSNDNIYVADSGNHCIRMITSVGAVSTIAGTAGVSSFVDGIGTVARFNSPCSIAVDSNFNLYVGDNVNDRIRKIIPSSAGWTVSTLAGGAGYGFLDGTGNAAKFSNPSGVAVDSCNNVYVADNWSHRIRKITPGGIVTTLAGSGSAAFADGIGVGASFNTPRGMCIDKSNNLYVADMSNHRIRKIAIDSANDLTNVRLPLTDSALAPIGTVTTPSATIYAAPLFPIFDTLGNMYFAGWTAHAIYKVTPTGLETRIAGSSGTPNVQSGFVDANGDAARFTNPIGIAIDSNNNIFVADFSNHRIRRIDTTGNVTTVAGSGAAGAWGDGLGIIAQLNAPVGLAFDSLGNLFFSEHGTSNRIRMMAPNGAVTTIAGNGTGGNTNGIGTAATFHSPTGLAFDSFGNLYIADQNNHCIRMITAASVRTTNGGVVSTFAGGSGPQWIDAVGAFAAFKNPCGICIDVNNNIYVGEQENRRIRMITPGAVVTTIAGNGTVASVDGLGLSAQFNNPYGVTIDPTGQFLYVGGNTGASTIRRITIGSIIGWGITTYLGNIVSPVLDNNGCTYMATQGQMNGYYIYKTTPGGFTYPIAGWNSTGTPVYTNSSNFANMICYKKINGLAVWPSGDIYVAETGNHCIRVLKPSMGSYAIWTYVGNKMALSSVTNPANGLISGIPAINLNSPRDVAIDPDYNLYVLDNGNKCIRKISANGSTSTFLTGVDSFAITYDKVSGLLFMTEQVNHCVSSIDPITGIKTVIAGTSGTSGSADGTAALFKNPLGIEVDTQGNLYVVDEKNNTIRRLTKSGTTWTTTTIVGSASDGSVNLDGIGTAARLQNPQHIAVASNGDLYVTCDSGEYTAASRSRCIKKITSGSWTVSTYFTFTGSITGNAGNTLRGFGITVDSSNNLFVSAAGSNGHYIYRITNVEDGYVIAGNTTTLGDGYNGGIDLPRGLCADPFGNIFVAAQSNHAIRILVPRYMSSVLAGNGAPAFQDGVGLAARFNGPNSIALDRSGNIIVADTGNNRIRKVTPAGIVTTIGGTGAATSTGDAGLATAATFNAPTSVSTDWFGVIYITENSSKIRALYPNYNVSLLAGSNSGFADGVGSAASFNTPTQIAWDNTNKLLWVADTGNNAARTVTPSGLVKLYLSYSNGINGITVDPSGLTYVLSAGTTIGKYTPTRPPFTIGQLVAVDSNGINVAYKKPVTALSNKQLAFRAVSGSDANPYTSASTSSTEYLEVDLQQDCEITQVTCVNNTGSGVASGTQVIMYDAAFRQQDSRTMSGGSTQTVDFRYAVSGAPVISGTTMKFAPLLLTDSSKYVPDTTLAGYIRGQYIVLENNSTANKTITPPVLYDIYGKKLGTGITSPDSTALSTYGSKWEYDLGEECYIRHIENTNNASIVIYNRLQAEVWRNYITTTITAPFPTQIPITSSAFTYPIRFVRISEAVTLKHVSVIDNRGIDVAVWKMVRKVSGTTVTFHAFNGAYDSNIVVTGGATDRIEIDLGLAYNITNIQIYHTGTTPNLTVTTYGATGAQILGVPSSYIGSTNTLTTYKANGLRTRYISVSAPSSTANINNLVIVDSLGRNVFLQYNTGNSGTYAGMSSLLKDTTEPVPTGLGKQSTTRSGNTVEFDLGREYNILYLVVYNNYTGAISTTLNPTVGTTLTETTIQFSDAYRNVMANRTIMGNMGVTYPIGNPISQTTATPTLSNYVDTSISGRWLIPITETVIATYYSLNTTVYGMAAAVSGRNSTIYYTTNAGIYKWQNGTLIQMVSKIGLRGIVLLDNTLYVCMSTNNQIGMIATTGTILTPISGRDGFDGTFENTPAGTLDGTGLDAFYKNPKGIAKDSSNNLYIADTGNHLIRKLSNINNVWTLTTVLGNPKSKYNQGNFSGGLLGIYCRVNAPEGVAVDSTGNIYIADTGNNFIRKISTSSHVTDVTSTAISPKYISVDSFDNIYYSNDTSRLNVYNIPSKSFNNWDTLIGTTYVSTDTTYDGYIKTSVPEPVISYPTSTNKWPRMEVGATETSVPLYTALVADNTLATITDIGTFVILENNVYFLESKTNKIRRYYTRNFSDNPSRILNCATPLLSEQASNTFALSGQNYFIPNRPFIGPFTQANTASAVVSNTFVAQITTEVIDVSMPPPVTGLYFVSITSTSISIGWVSGGGSGTSYVFTLNGAPVTPVLSGLTASFNSLSPETVLYEIGVYTSNTNGSSFPATITSYPNTTAPVLSVLSATSTSITVQWTGGDFTNYYTYTLDSQSLNPTVDNSKINKTATFTRKADGATLVGNTEYRIVVISNRNTGVNFPSTTLIVKTAPVVPVLFFGTINQTLSWSGGDGATSYRILRNEVDMTSLATIDSVAKTIRFTNALGNTVYTFILTAINTNGSSESDPLTITTGPAAPVLIIAGITATGVTVSWTGADGASSFRFILYLKKSSDTAYVNPFGKIQGANVVNGGGILDVNAVAFSPTNAAQPPVFLAQDGTNVRAVSAGATPNARYFVGTVGDFRYDYYIAASASSPYSLDVGTTFVSALTNSFTAPYPKIIQGGSSITITDMISNSKYTVGVVAINTNGESSSLVDVKTGGTFTAQYLTPTTVTPSNITSISSSEITQSGFKITYNGGDGATSLTVNIIPNLGIFTYNLIAKWVIFSSLDSSITYTVTIRALNLAEISNTSTLNIRTLDLLINITVPSVTVNSATIQWNRLPAATLYKYTIGSNAEQTTTDTGPLTISGLIVGTLYSVTINAFSSAGVQIATATKTFTTAPAAPIGFLQSTPYTPTSITVSWSNVPSTILYPTTGYVFRLDDSPLIPIISGSGTSATFNNILSGSSNTIMMKYSSTGAAAIITAYTSPAKPMITPSSISSITTNSFVISWLSSAGANTYTIYYVASSGTSSIQVNYSTTTQTIGSLSPNTTYVVYIVATSSNNITSRSDDISVLTAPSKPTNLIVTNYTIGSSTSNYGCTLSWICVGGAKSYTITGLRNTVTDISNTSYQVTGYDAGGVYNNVRVISVNDAASSIESDAVSVVMLPGRITNIASSYEDISNPSTSCKLSWNIDGATSNEYWWGTSDNRSTWINTGLTTTNLTISGMSPGAVFTVYICAKNITGYGTQASITVALELVKPVIALHDFGSSRWTSSSIPDVRYVRISNTTAQVINLSQIALYDINDINVAYKKPVSVVSASDDLHIYPGANSPDAIVDGSYNTRGHSSSGAYISPSTNQPIILEIDLESDRNIDDCKFWGRSDHSLNRTNGVTVELLDRLRNKLAISMFTGSITNTWQNCWFTSPIFNNVRYVIISHTNNSYVINISRIAVYDINGNNIAAGKSISSSATHHESSSASNLVKSDLAIRNYPDIWHSRDTGPSAWGIIDLGGNYTITTVRVWNRADCCSDRAEGIRVELQNSSNTFIASATLKGNRPIQDCVFFTNTRLGTIPNVRYARVYQSRNEYLEISQIALYENGVNHALGKRVTVVGGGWWDSGGGASMVDGILEIKSNFAYVWHTTSISMTNSLIIDLQSSYTIKEVKVWNFINSQERASGVKVELYDNTTSVETLRYSVQPGMERPGSGFIASAILRNKDIQTCAFSPSTFDLIYTGGGEATVDIKCNNVTVYTGLTAGQVYPCRYYGLGDTSTSTFQLSITTRKGSKSATSDSVLIHKPPLPFILQKHVTGSMYGVELAGIRLYPPPLFATLVMIWSTNTQLANGTAKWNILLSVNAPAGSPFNPNITLINDNANPVLVSKLDNWPVVNGYGHGWFRARAYNPNGVMVAMMNTADIYCPIEPCGSQYDSQFYFNINTGEAIP